MSVAIVILNWNGKKLLEEFLPSIMQFSEGATIYMADNASSDDSVSFVSEKFPEIRIIQNKVNGGFSKGYNDALSSLSEDIFILLNSDVEVTENWLGPVLSEFSKDESLVAAQPKILDYNNKDYFEYAGAAGGYIDKLGYPYCRGRVFNSIEKDEGQYDDIVEIFWATGACLFVKREAFWKTGGLDEDFFSHQEEIDLCWRMQANGGTIKYIGAAVVYHVGGATLASSDPKKTFYNFRNTLLILIKNVKSRGIWWVIILRLILDGIAGFQFLLQGKGNHFLAVIKAHFSFYGLLARFLRKRKTQATRLKYFKINSIVWKYFIVKKRNFNTL
ncbi:MAG: glycosyltransferase family 2 protein [Bacteroidetes bacterium]|nr:glycosyltransferase family 2 protein [Bacteroidota bacterium]